MKTKYISFPYTRYFREGNAPALYNMDKLALIRLLGHEIIDAIYNGPGGGTITCTALDMMYEAGRAAGIKEGTQRVTYQRGGNKRTGRGKPDPLPFRQEGKQRDRPENQI